MRRASKYPVLLAELSADGIQFKAWCPYCAKYHYHGAAALGHRRAHCIFQDSPFIKTGYILRQQHGHRKDIEKC